MTEQPGVRALERLADSLAETRELLAELEQRRSDRRTLMIWTNRAIARNTQRTEARTMQQSHDFRTETEREVITEAAHELERAGLAAAMRQAVTRLVCYSDADERQADRDARDAELAERDGWSDSYPFVF